MSHEVVTNKTTTRRETKTKSEIDLSTWVTSKLSYYDVHQYYITKTVEISPICIIALIVDRMNLMYSKIILVLFVVLGMQIARGNNTIIIPWR